MTIKIPRLSAGRFLAHDGSTIIQATPEVSAPLDDVIVNEVLGVRPETQVAHIRARSVDRRARLSSGRPPSVVQVHTQLLAQLGLAREQPI